MSVPSAVRVLRLIEWLAGQSEPVTLTQACQAFDLPKSSTLLLLKTLIGEGYAERDEDGRYRLIRLPGEPTEGHRAWGTILRIADPYLRQAVAEGQETGFIAILTDESKIRYLNKVLPDMELHYNRDITKDRVAHEVASGLAILSALPEEEIEQYIARVVGDADDAAGIRDRIREAAKNGFAVNLKGRVDGASGVAVPIRDAKGRPVGAVNLSGPTDRVIDKVDTIARAARRAAQKVSEELVRRSESIRGGAREKSS